MKIYLLDNVLKKISSVLNISNEKGNLMIMEYIKRNVFSGNLSIKDIDTTVHLNGWVHKVRDLGGLCFIDLRDYTGIVQVVLNPENFNHLSEIKTESCLSITGKVIKRHEDNINNKIPTGEIEVIATDYKIISTSKPLPFQISDEDEMKKVNEELRFKYRYLDLRRPSVYSIIALRSAVLKKFRNFFDSKGFLEIETPIITKSTPEGARDYLIPYRINPGYFYALPQSPQQYKQLLMVGGVERYYQIAKCFRDESQRSDRQPEFTQLDVEMSFVDQEEVLNTAEEMSITVINEIIDEFKLPKNPIKPFKRISYHDAISKYGSDKPDLRFDLELFDITPHVKNSNFGVFKNCIENGGIVKGIRFPNGAKYSKKEILQIESFCKEFGAKGLAWIASGPEDAEFAYTSPSGLKLRSPIIKFFKEEELELIIQESSLEKNDLLCFIADNQSTVHHVLGRLRNYIGEHAKLINERDLAFCWVLDFPLVEWNEDEQRWDSSHHPFTMPHESDLQYIDTDPSKIRGQCYDIVCNGFEWASGSIRIHDPKIQQKIFHLLGISEEIQNERFRHLIEAFEYGAPPHGGFAPGIDRLLMLLTGGNNIKEVIPFPKIAGGQDPLMNAPSLIDASQWAEIGLKKI